MNKLTAVQRAVLYELLFDTLRRHLCLESRYLDPVEQDKARTSAHTYLNERWAFAPDEKLDTGRYLILGKRPEYKGKPRTDLVTGGPRFPTVAANQDGRLLAQQRMRQRVAQWKDAEWAVLIEKTCSRQPATMVMCKNMPLIRNSPAGA